VSLFGAINIAGTGINAEQIWLDTIGSNIANANDTGPLNQPMYQDQQVLVQPSPGVGPGGVPDLTSTALGTGVSVEGLVTAKPNGVPAYDPTSVYANAQGYVKTPGISLANQLGNLVQAQYGYEANAGVVSHAKAAYESVLGIVS